MSRLQPPTLVAASTERMLAACIAVPRRRDDQHTCRQLTARTYRTVDSDLQECFGKLCSGDLPWPCYLHGDIGVGKTRAALALCDQKEFARFWTLDEIITSIVGRSTPWSTPWRFPQGPLLAILDEIGTHETTRDLEYDALKLFSEWREDTPVIYISNHSPKQLARLQLYDGRVVSRLCCGTIHHLVGHDRRLRAE